MNFFRMTKEQFESDLDEIVELFPTAEKSDIFCTYDISGKATVGLRGL